MELTMGDEALGKREQQRSEKERVRYYDEKSGFWYVIYWDDTMECYVSQLESGQHSIMVADE